MNFFYFFHFLFLFFNNIHHQLVRMFVVMIFLFAFILYYSRWLVLFIIVFSCFLYVLNTHTHTRLILVRFSRLIIQFPLIIILLYMLHMYVCVCATCIFFYRHSFHFCNSLESIHDDDDRRRKKNFSSSSSSSSSNRCI